MKEQMTVTILGSGTCVPSLERYPCSALMKVGDSNILLDIGPGIIGQLMKVGVHINDIDMIFLSHFHVDHCADLAPFLFATKYPGFMREKPLKLIGGTGIRLLFSRLNEAYGGNLEMPESKFEIIELASQGSMRLEIGSLKLSWIKPEHKPESRSYRFSKESGFSWVYSGDTDYSKDLIDLAKGTDILVCECALPDELKVPGHSTPGVAGKMAARAKVKKLILTHFYPECEHAGVRQSCEMVYDGEIVIARDLLTITD